MAERDSSVDEFCLKPNWFGEIRRCFEKKLLSWFKIHISNIFENGDKIEIGLEFPQLVLLPLLYMGITWAILRSLGNTP